MFLFISHPHFLLNIFFSLFPTQLLLRLFCSCPCLSSVLIFFNHSLSRFLNPSSQSTSPLASFFIRSKPHFHHSTYSGVPFSLQMPSFCRMKALVQNQFRLLSVMFFPINPPLIQIFSPSQHIVFRR